MSEKKTRGLRLVQSDQAVTESEPEAGTEPQLTREEAALMAAYLTLSNGEVRDRLAKQWGAPVGQVAVSMLQESEYTPEVKAALFPHFASALLAGFFLGLEVGRGPR